MSNVKPFKVDFSGVADNDYNIPAGKYLAKVKDIDRRDSSKGNPQLVFELEIVSGLAKGKKIRYYITLTAKSLWVLRNFIEAMGITVPKAAITINPASYLNKTLGIDVGEREGTDGKTYPDVKGVFRPTSAVASSDDEDEDDQPF